MSEGLFLGSVGQKAKVTDAYEAVRQDVQQEATDEFMGLDGEGLFSIAVFPISVAQGDLAIVDLNNAIVRERHPVGVAAEVVENGLGRTEGLFRINDPILLARDFDLVVDSLEFPSIPGFL